MSTLQGDNQLRAAACKPAPADARKLRHLVAEFQVFVASFSGDPVSILKCDTVQSRLP